MKRPNAVAHMASHGFVLGYLSSLIFIWISAITFIGIPNDIVYFIQFSIALPLFVGSIPGLFIGFTTGSVLGFVTHRIRYPLMIDAFQKAYKIALFGIGGLTFISSAILLFPLAVFFMYQQAALLLVISPAVIATVASIYAVNRYMAQLRKWSRIPVEYPKAKRKPKNQLAYDKMKQDDLLVEKTEFKQDSSSTVQG
jgi:hypothetical protein